MKDYQTTITNCIVMNLLEEVEQPYSKPAIKTQAVKLLDQCGNTFQQSQEKVFNVIDKYSSEELKELANKAADRVIETYNKIQGKGINVVNGTLDNTPAYSTYIKLIETKCTYLNVWYPELPNLLLGTVDCTDMFNASEFLVRRKSDKDVIGFILQYKETIDKYADKLGMKQLIFRTQNNEYLIHAHLAFAFVSYVDPNFTIYMHDRMHELFSNGFLVSDNYLAVSAKQRLPKKVLNQLAEKE